MSSWITAVVYLRTLSSCLIRILIHQLANFAKHLTKIFAEKSLHRETSCCSPELTEFMNCSSTVLVNSSFNVLSCWTASHLNISVNSCLFPSVILCTDWSIKEGSSLKGKTFTLNIQENIVVRDRKTRNMFDSKTLCRKIGNTLLTFLRSLVSQ